MTDATKRFSNRVDYYLKYRPSYPPEIIDFLAQTCGLTSTSVIADIGSGTGFLAKLFCKNGNPVFGVEPNIDMRLAGEIYLQSYPNFTNIDATAEATSLPNQSVDFITAGQAFHWFKPDQTHQEFQRIIKPGGWIVLIWNDRQIDTSPFLREYEQILQTYAIDYRKVDHKNVSDAQISQIFGPEVALATFEYHQLLDLEAFTGRVLSSSYAPLANHPNYNPMMKELERIFETYETRGRIDFAYTTKIYYCQLQPLRLGESE